MSIKSQLQMARLIASQIALNRYFGEYDTESGKAGCVRPSEIIDGAHAQCAVRFCCCCDRYRAVHIKYRGDWNQMFGGINGVRFDHWSVYDTPEPTLRTPIMKVPAHLVDGYLAFMIPSRVDVIADTTKRGAA